MRNKLEAITSAVLAIAAVAIAISTVRRAFFAEPAAVSSVTTTDPQFLPSWKEAFPIGRRTGDSAAAVTIVEFTDLECPACRRFELTLGKVVEAYPHDVSVVYVHYPLPMHRFALGAARADECAYEYGKFREWVDAIFEKQDSLGLKSWGSYASEAGLADTTAINQCAKDPAPIERIEAGLALGNKIRITGTPTVIVNGWRFPYTPTEEELVEVIESFSAGEHPFD